jgi:hypothetical protein
MRNINGLLFMIAISVPVCKYNEKGLFYGNIGFLEERKANYNGGYVANYVGISATYLSVSNYILMHVKKFFFTRLSQRLRNQTGIFFDISKIL